MAERIEPRALRHRLRLEDEMALGLTLGPQDRQVVDHIDAQHRADGGAAGDVDHIDPIALRRVHQLGNHMVVGDDASRVVGGKTRARGCLRRRTGFHHFDLHHMLGKLFEDLRRGAGDELRLRCRRERHEQAQKQKADGCEQSIHWMDRKLRAQLA